MGTLTVKWDKAWFSGMSRLYVFVNDENMGMVVPGETIDVDLDSGECKVQMTIYKFRWLQWFASKTKTLEVNGAQETLITVEAWWNYIRRILLPYVAFIMVLMIGLLAIPGIGMLLDILMFPIAMLPTLVLAQLPMRATVENTSESSAVGDDW